MGKCAAQLRNLEIVFVEEFLANENFRLQGSERQGPFGRSCKADDLEHLRVPPS